MTDTAVRPSIAAIMTTEALIVDISRVRTQLEYIGAIEEVDGVVHSVDESAPTHLISSWNTLAAEARKRGFAA